MRSFDAPRERSAPRSFSALSIDGVPTTHVFEGLTLVVAVKSQCDGCRDFVNSPLDELGGVNVVILSASADGSSEWTNAKHPILVAPQALDELEIKWPPFYVLVDAGSSRVVSEGVVFGPSQVASEIERFLLR